MKIRRLWVDNFRGIRSLDWTLPTEPRLIALIGPGDCGKSTILDSVQLLLTDRPNVSISDSDFYAGDTESEILIRAALVDLPQSILQESAFGLFLSGIDASGEIHQDPEDYLDPCLLVAFKVDESLEPEWSVVRPDGNTKELYAGQRRTFGVFRVDERVDSQLRWTRTSALGRLSSGSRAEREVLALAARAAGEALADHGAGDLQEMVGRVQQKVNEAGSGSFVGLRPGLDTSRGSMGTTLALYEGEIPLTNYGFGSRRLASLAIQQLAAGDKSIAIVDELEAGLEPHRVVKLLSNLAKGEMYSQVLVTTHSAVVVEQADLAGLCAVQNSGGEVSITSLAGNEEANKLRRTRPSSLLARRVLVVEGNTEHGILLELVSHWDQERSGRGQPTTAGEGATIADGQSGSHALKRALTLTELSCEVAALIDNDDRTIDRWVTRAQDVGVVVIRWDVGHCTETQLTAALDVELLDSLLRLGIEVRASESTVLDDLNHALGGNQSISSCDVSRWLTGGMGLEIARQTVGLAMREREWFKTVEHARRLGKWLVENRSNTGLSSMFIRFDLARQFLYGSEPAAQASSR